MQTNSGNFLIITLIIISILRIGEIFFSEREKIQGRIYFKWNIFFLIGGYILLIGGAILEYFMAGRNINFFITGIVLGMLIIRFFLKRWAVKTLGKYWSAHIEVRETQQLVTAGPYKYLRHPAYLSNIMEVSATPLILNAYFSFLMAFFVYLFFIYFRIQSEEKILIQKFGKKYEEYKRTTWTLIPLPFQKSQKNFTKEGVKKNESTFSSTTT